MKSKKRRAYVPAVLGVAVLVLGAIGLAACGGGSSSSSGSSSGSSDNSPYVFGTISTETGPFVLTSQTKALQAYINKYNEEGGYEGHPIELKVVDDAGNPSKSVAAARQLVQQDKVIGMVGSASIFDCEVNGAYYKANGISSISPGYGNSCFTQENFYPVTLGANVQSNPATAWAVREFGQKKVAYIGGETPQNHEAEGLLKQMLAGMGAELVSADFISATAGELTGSVVRAKQAGAEIVVMATTSPLQLVTLVEDANQQGFGPKDGITWLGPTTAYFPEFPAAMSKAGGDGVYVGSIFTPFETDDPVALEAKETLEEEFPDQELNGFADVGWVTGIALQEALEHVEGELDSESYGKALDSLSEVDLKLYPKTLDWTKLPRDIPPAAQMLEVSKNRFKPVSGWVYPPEVEAEEG